MSLVNMCCRTYEPEESGVIGHLAGENADDHILDNRCCPIR